MVAGPEGKIGSFYVHTNQSARIALRLMNKDAESVRIVLGMMLPLRGHGRLTHRWVADFKSALTQVLKEGLGGHPGRHINAYRIECSLSQRQKLLIID